MVRSLYSGVAGMVSHQTKMDVIGNNISNVSTYGYKSSRATFKDVYYQTNNTAMAATPTSGGTNPKQVGYGAKVGSVDVNHSQSVMSTTGYTLDVAIAGEGYLQVMDADGNIFYTKAGMLDIDAEGNLVDINGYFVLGASGNPSGQGPSSNRIKIDLPYEAAASAKATDTINDLGFTIEADNQNKDGNVNIVFQSSTSLPLGQPVSATITSASIVVTVNANEHFNTLLDFQNAVNTAITTANGGIQHPAGDFQISLSDPAKFPTGGLSGAEIVDPDFNVKLGKVELAHGTPDLNNYFEIKSVGDNFSMDTSGAATGSFSATLDGSNNLTLTVTDGTKTYTRTVSADNLKKSGTVLLSSTTDSSDSIVVSYPNLNTITSNGLSGKTAALTITPSVPSQNLGIGNGNFLLKGGTEGGEQTVADLTGISINNKGVLVAEHPTLGSVELGRIDLATFANPAGLSQVGDTYFAVSRNSGEPIVTIAGTEGTGDILGGTLETSNTDLAHEMADMITTQRGFQACSRMITVSDSMLEELINLKR